MNRLEAYDDDDDEYELDDSRLGIASFAITCAAGLFEFAVFAYAGILESTTPNGIDEESTQAMLLGLAIIGGLLVALVGTTLGVAALFQSEYRKRFAVLGALIGGLVMVAGIGLICFGLMME